MGQKKSNRFTAFLMKISTSVVITLVIAIISLVAILHTSYGLPLLQKGIEKISNIKLKASNFVYSYKQPLTFHFEKLQLSHLEQEITEIDELEFKLAPFSSLTKKSIVLKEMWVKGTSIDLSSNINYFDSIQAKELNLENVDIIGAELKLLNTDIQIKNWRKGEQVWGDWRGNFLISADKVEYLNEQFNALLINGSRKNDEWQFWNSSVTTEFGNISGSMKINDGNISFEQLTLSDAKIQPKQNAQAQKFQDHFKPWLEDKKINIQRMDFINVNAAVKTANVEHLNLTAHNLIVKNGKPEWQDKTQSQFTFNADFLSFRQWVLFDLLGETHVSKQGVKITGLTSKLMNEGFISVVGDILKDSVELSELRLDEVKISLNQDEVNNLDEYWQGLEKLKIDKMYIKGTDITVAEPDFPIHLAGLNIRASDIMTQVVDGSRTWQGELNLNAQGADINQIPMINPVVFAKAKDGVWQINSEIPFDYGQVQFKAKIDTLKPSQPWELAGQGISVPNKVYQNWLDLDLPISGEHDLDFKLSGLSITKDALRYSLSGNINAMLQNSTLHPTQEEPLFEELAALLLPKPQPEPEDTTSALEILVSQTESLLEELDIASQDLDEDELEKIKEEFANAQEQLPIITALNADKIRLVIDRGQVLLAPMQIKTDEKELILEGTWDLVTKQGGFITK